MENMRTQSEAYDIFIHSGKLPKKMDNNKNGKKGFFKNHPQVPGKLII